MAILKRIKNGTGDGAGRSRYVLQKAVAIRTDIPSPLSLLVADTENLSPEIKKELADEFNRTLLLHQKSYKTSHYVISFGHFLTDDEISEVLDRLQDIFTEEDDDRYRLFAVHREHFGTAIHIVESADSKGRLRRLTPREFRTLKEEIIEEMLPYMNERELEIAANFEKGISTQDWKHQIEIKAPERSWKEHIRRAIIDATPYLQEGNIKKVVETLKERGVTLQKYEAGQLSPNGNILKHSHLYAIYEHPQKGSISVRVDKKMTHTYRLWINSYERVRDELTRLEREVGEIRERVRGTGEREREAGSREKGIRAESFDTTKIRELTGRIEEYTRSIAEYREQLQRENQRLAEELGIDPTGLEQFNKTNRTRNEQHIERPIERTNRQVRDRDRGREIHDSRACEGACEGVGKLHGRDRGSNRETGKENKYSRGNRKKYSRENRGTGKESKHRILDTFSDMLSISDNDRYSANKIAILELKEQWEEYEKTTDINEREKRKAERIIDIVFEKFEQKKEVTPEEFIAGTYKEFLDSKLFQTLYGSTGWYIDYNRTEKELDRIFKEHFGFRAKEINRAKEKAKEEFREIEQRKIKEKQELELKHRRYERGLSR